MAPQAYGLPYAPWGERERVFRSWRWNRESLRDQPRAPAPKALPHGIPSQGRRQPIRISVRHMPKLDQAMDSRLTCPLIPSIIRWPPTVT